MEPVAKTSVLVTLTDHVFNNPQLWDETLERLKSAGFEPKRGLLRNVGVVHGQIDPARIPALEAIPGVKSVSVDRAFRLD